MMLASRLMPPGISCVYLLLNFITFFTILYVSTSINRGFELMIQLTPSVQGGVVSEPLYLNRVLFDR